MRATFNLSQLESALKHFILKAFLMSAKVTLKSQFAQVVATNLASDCTPTKQIVLPPGNGHLMAIQFQGREESLFVHSRPQRLRSIWPAPWIETSGRLQSVLVTDWSDANTMKSDKPEKKKKKKKKKKT